MENISFPGAEQGPGLPVEKPRFLRTEVSPSVPSVGRGIFMCPLPLEKPSEDINSLSERQPPTHAQSPTKGCARPGVSATAMPPPYPDMETADELLEARTRLSFDVTHCPRQRPQIPAGSCLSTKAPQ